MTSRKPGRFLMGYVAVAVATLGSFGVAGAQTGAAPASPDKSLRFEEQDSVATTLKKLEGRVVKIRLAGNGEEITGKVQKVGKDLVHVSDLAGREFFDALVRVDQISAVAVQVRGR